MKIHNDYSDMIQSLIHNRTEFVIVGAYALAFHGKPRYTGDLDIWINPTPDNAKSVIVSLKEYGFNSLGIDEKDIISGNVIQLGYAPVRIDLITKLEGLTSDEILNSRIKGKFGEHQVNFIGRDALIKNKKALGRHKDLADIEALDEL